MRCPDCNKFVPYEQEDPEIYEEEVTDSGSYFIKFQINLNCGECGMQLKTAEIEYDGTFDEPEGWDPEKNNMHGYAIECDPGSHTFKTEGKGRGMKTFYGGQITVKITHPDFPKWEYKDTVEEFIQASAMDEC